MNYKLIVEAIREIGEKCEQVSGDKACEFCPLFENNTKCLKWEGNLEELNADDLREFMEFEPPYFIDDMFDEDLGTERG